MKGGWGGIDYRLRKGVCERMCRLELGKQTKKNNWVNKGSPCHLVIIKRDNIIRSVPVFSMQIGLQEGLVGIGGGKLLVYMRK